MRFARFLVKQFLGAVWFDDQRRPTRHVDLLGYDDSSSETMLAIVKEICETAAGDGIHVDSNARRIDLIREESENAGKRTAIARCRT